MKRLNLLGTAIMLGLFFAAAVSAKTVECDNTHGAGSMKSKVCEMLNAENELINELEGYVDNACKNKNSASCDSLVMRKNKLKNVQDRAHEENNSLEENDFQEMIEGAYKGKNFVPTPIGGVAGIIRLDLDLTSFETMPKVLLIEASYNGNPGNIKGAKLFTVGLHTE